jgi:hypothetical protein
MGAGGGSIRAVGVGVVGDGMGLLPQADIHTAAASTTISAGAEYRLLGIELESSRADK